MHEQLQHMHIHMHMHLACCLGNEWLGRLRERDQRGDHLGLGVDQYAHARVGVFMCMCIWHICSCRCICMYVYLADGGTLRRQVGYAPPYVLLTH